MLGIKGIALLEMEGVVPAVDSVLCGVLRPAGQECILALANRFPPFADLLWSEGMNCFSQKALPYLPSPFTCSLGFTSLP